MTSQEGLYGLVEARRGRETRCGRPREANKNKETAKKETKEFS